MELSYVHQQGMLALIRRQDDFEILVKVIMHGHLAVQVQDQQLPVRMKKENFLQRDLWRLMEWLPKLMMMGMGLMLNRE